MIIVYQVLTSNQSLCNLMCRKLGTVNPGLIHLEIGECHLISKLFSVVLKKFVNLTFLRIETFDCKSKTTTRKIFEAIRSLKNLTTLQLMNISFNVTVKQELEKCDHIQQLLIVTTHIEHVNKPLNNYIYLLNVTKFIYNIYFFFLAMG